MERQNKHKVLSGDILKLIAMCAMTIDHVGAVLLPQYQIFRIIGRLAFPIYCFLLVEGFYHTSNWKKYMCRLFFFAILSELPFDLAFYGTVCYMGHQNVFFTLFFGLVLIQALSSISGDIQNAAKFGTILKEYGMLILISLVVELTHMDYGAFGIFIISIFYVFRKNFVVLAVIQVVLSVMMGGIQCFAGIALLPLYLYDERKRGNKKLKYLFYGYYPVHLLILFIIAKLILLR